MLDSTETVCIAAIMQDSIDRLHIVGRLLPVPMPASGTRPNIPDADVIAAAEVIPNIKTKESRHELFPKNLKNEIQTKATFDDDVFKLQRDRSFLEKTLQKTLIEIKCSNKYTVLCDTVEIERVKKAQYEAVIEKEQELNERITRLGKVLAKNKEEKDYLISRCSDTVTRLTDQLREAKVRTGLEEKFVQNQCNAHIFQIKKKLRTAGKEITQEMDKIKHNIDQEIRINKAFDDYVRINLDSLEQKMEYWMEKHETETEAKEREIEMLTSVRQSVLDRYTHISNLLQAINVELEVDRREKEKFEKQTETEAKLCRSIVRIQAWWRGIMVRLFLGPYKKLVKFIKDRKAELAKRKK